MRQRTRKATAISATGIRIITDRSQISSGFHEHLDLDSPSTYYILYLNALPIGCAQIIEHAANIFELAYVYISPEYRGRGYGRDFIRFIVYNHQGQSIQALTVIPQFFEKLGFVRQHRYPEFVDHGCAECQACDPKACIPLVLQKPGWLHKFRPFSETYYRYHELLKQQDFLGSEFSVANELSWSYTENIYYTEISGFLFFMIFPYGEEPTGVVFPYQSVPQTVIDAFIERLELLNIAEISYLTGIGKAYLSRYLSNYSFTFLANRDNADYLYLVEDFAEFTGSAFEKKRNRLKKFLRQFPEHQLINYAAQLDKAILDFAWNSMVVEMQIGVTSYEVLWRGLQSNLYQGLVVTVAGNIVGVLLYSELNPKTVIVHFELIDTRYDGVAQFLNNELGKSLLGKYKYINREQDLGVEGLRKSKLSYKPYRILMKYTARFTRN